MATPKQIEAARTNIKKAQSAWKAMPHRQRALAQPQGPKRARPGTKGGGRYYRVIVRPKGQFTSFRIQDVGDPGGLQRVAGRRSSGSWATHAWLINKDMAHIEDGMLVADNEDAIDLLATLGSQPKHQKGDIFIAKDRYNVPEKDKPTPAQQEAWNANIKKAQEARRSKAHGNT